MCNVAEVMICWNQNEPGETEGIVLLHSSLQIYGHANNIMFEIRTLFVDCYCLFNDVSGSDCIT
jgi:hypothetical protein